MIKFISGCVVGIWLDGEIIAVMEENNDPKTIIQEAIKDRLSCDDVKITKEFKFDSFMQYVNIPVEIEEDGDDRYDTVELTWITKY